MPRFIVERNLFRQQTEETDSAETIAQQAQQLADYGHELKWMATIITDVKLYVIYVAPSAEYLRQTAHRHNVAFHRLLQIENEL